jgi:hypothetical protein
MTLNGKAFHMSEQPRNKVTQGEARETREERLAAQLRENLRRRKAQARAINGKPDESSAPVLSKPASDR